MKRDAHGGELSVRYLFSVNWQLAVAELHAELFRTLAVAAII
jgi:hypothetical protein